jgi:tetratricopeptide (TPR) repeat protein
MSSSKVLAPATWLVMACAVVLLLVAGGCGNPTVTPSPGAPVVPIEPQLQVTAQTAEEYFQLGNQFFQAGDLAQAELAYKEALAMEPANAAYLTNLGVVYYSQGRLQDAQDAYVEGLKMAPDDPELNYLLGAVHLQLSQLDQARERFLKANEANPELAEPYYGLGVLYKMEGKRDEAITAFETFLEIGPSQDPNAIEQAEAQLEELRAGQ